MADMTREEIEDLIAQHQRCAESYSVDEASLRGRLHRKTISALRQLLAETEWRPIESAPKKDRLLLWLADEGFSITGCWDAKEEMWRLPEWDMWTSEDGMHQITHWLPLPEPPANGEDR